MGGGEGACCWCENEKGGIVFFHKIKSCVPIFPQMEFQNLPSRQGHEKVLGISWNFIIKDIFKTTVNLLHVPLENCPHTNKLCLHKNEAMVITLLNHSGKTTIDIVINALVNVSSQGILTFEKMCCQSPLYRSKVPCHKCISALGCIDFYVKMLLDGCSIPNNVPWLPVFSYICQPSNTCAFIQIQELENVKNTQTYYFMSENPWVSGWGLIRSRWKRLKICNNSFKLGQNSPRLKCFCQISTEWVSIRLSYSDVWVK